MFRLAMAALLVGVLHGQTKQSPQELLQEAVTLHQQGKLDDAIHDYSLFLDMYPEAAQVRSNLGAALAAAGRYTLAIDQYQLALSAKPDPAVRLNDVRLNLALAFYKTSKYKDAARELQTVIDSDAQNKKAKMLLADCDLHQGENKKAIELLRPLHDADSNDLGIAYLLGTALVRDGDTEEAKPVINQIMSQGDTAEVHLLLGTTRFSAHDYAPAVADLAKAVELNANIPEAWSYYGLALFSTGDMTASRTAFQKALALDPNDFQANLHLGTLLRLDEDYSRAMDYLTRAVSVRPTDLAVAYQIALVDMAQSKIEKAREGLEAVVKASPSFTEAHVSLATVYYREKRKEDGDRERAIVQKLNAAKQAEQPGAKLSAAEGGK